FGREFYTDQWGPDDYNQMFNFFFECSAFYLKHGLIEPPEINAGQRKLIGELGGVDLKEFLDEKIIDAQLNIKDKLAKGVEDYMVKWNKKDLYDEFIKTYSGQQKYYPSPNRFTMKVTIYLKYRDVFVSADYGQRRMFLLNLSKLPALPEPEEQNNEEFGEVTESENEFKTLSDFKTNYILVNSVETHTLLLSKLKDSKAFTFDTETAGSESGSALTIHSLQLVGIGFCFSKNEAFYVPVPEDYTLAGKLLAHYKPHFENSATIKTGHNLKFDINVLCRYGITVNGQCFDTMIAHYLIDGDAEHGLKALSRNLLGYQQIEIEDIIGSGTHQTSMRQVPLKDVTDYASEDCDQTMQIAEALIPLLIEKQLDSLFYNVEMPMVNVLADMEYQGIKIDADVLGELEFQAREEIDLLTKQIFNVAGLEFKITSGKELGAVLFEKLNLPVITKTKTGDYSTSKPTLTKLRNEHPIIPLILKYKSTSSLLNTFISALPNYIHPDTGRVHTNFNQAFVVTGRLSSSNPNLQNIPHSNEGFGKEIRKAFIPRDENHVIISADYSQIELRVLSHFSNDPVMIDAFKNDMDLHTVTASKIFGVPVSEIAKDDKRRKVAKTINFGLNYLMSAKTLAERIAAETGEEIDVAKAKEYMDSYFAEFSGVRNYHEEAYQNATIKGYCTTLLGRRRYLPEIDSQIKSKRMASKRLAVNFPIQGSAASIIKKAMINLHQELINGGFKTKILLQIHDELVFDCPKEELEAVIPIIKRVMEAAVELKVPLKVDIGKGANWLEAH
ncbi:MAG TPA: DNA polymerase, partial [Bacteroidia bacterium]|nr:DNA polymerase [Bacteroidia bacterium]